MDPIGITYGILMVSLLGGLGLMSGAGKAHRLRHLRAPVRLWLALLVGLCGFGIASAALLLVAVSPEIEGDFGFLVIFIIGHLVIVALTVGAPLIHRRSGFRPFVVTVHLARGGAVTRETVLEAIRAWCRERGYRTPPRNLWTCDLVTHTGRSVFWSLYLFWTVTEGGGEIEVQALIDVEDYVVRDGNETKRAKETAEGIGTLFDGALFAGRVLDRQAVRLSETRYLLGPGPEPEEGAPGFERRPGALERFARYLLHYKTTRPGKFVVGALVASTSLGATSLRIPVYHLVTALFGLTVVAWFIGLALRPRLIVKGSLPPRTGADQPVEQEFFVTNRSWLPAFDVSAGLFHLPPSIRDNRGESTIPVLRRGETASLAVQVHPRKRGLYTLPDLTPFSTFPFNLFRSSATRCRTGNLLVLPAFHPLIEIDVPIGRRYQPGGIALTSNIGESPEYIGNREYRDGDPLRRIDWKSWARLARPAVREYQEEYYCRIALALDTYVSRERTEEADGFPELEAAVSLTAAMADALSRGEFLIDVFAAGPDLHVFRAGRHLAHFDNVLEILAGLHACRRNPFDVVAPALAEQLGNITTVVCAFLDWDASREKIARAALEAGCAVKIIVVRDGDTTEPLAGAEVEAESVVQLSPAAVRRGEVQFL